MAPITRRHFVRQAAFGAAFYGCPFKAIGAAQRLFNADEQNVAPLNAKTIQKLRSGIAGTVITPDSSNYEAVRLVFNRAFDRHPAVIVHKSCFTTPPVIGADGIGSTFGDSATGIVDGPGQFNIDASLLRNVAISWPKEGSSLQVRADFFNALNHPQFSNPNAVYGSSSFGVISSSSVNPRVVQLALKLIF